MFIGSNTFFYNVVSQMYLTANDCMFSSKIWFPFSQSRKEKSVDNLRRLVPVLLMLLCGKSGWETYIMQ